ncbi:hypothetical protein D3C74_452610 [compost metagenome]
MITQILPGVRLRSCTARTREDLIQTLQYRLIQKDLQAAQGAFELLQRARADDRRGDCGIRQQPGEGDIILRFAKLKAQFGKRL